MSTTTTNYGFTLPAVADPIDEDLWGTELNTNFSSLDDILPTPSANKYGAIAVQNSTDNGLDYITSQGTSGQYLISNGSDALPSFQSVANAASAIGNLLFPVGSYYLNETVSTNPNTLLGFGTWTAVTDKFIVAHGSTYTTTGGAATATIAQGNLPNINLHISSVNGVLGDGTYATGSTTTIDGTTISNPNTSNKQYNIPLGGSGTPIDIIPPYQAVYIWKRTA